MMSRAMSNLFQRALFEAVVLGALLIPVLADSGGSEATTTADSVRRIYVDAIAGGVNDGSSWTDAYSYLQDALVDAHDSQVPVEIRVAQGVYKPDQSPAHPDGTGDRNTSFRLLDGVAIKGGFAGVGAVDPNVRDVVLYETVLSGDLAGDDVPLVDPCDLLTEPTRAENTYHIVTAEPCGRSAVLDGFTIRSGKAKDGGAGLYLSVRPCLPSIRDCTFVGNSAYAGGAACVYAGVGPELIDCAFLQNAAVYGGGAMTAVVGRNTPPGADEFAIRRCTFAWNVVTAGDKGARGIGGAIGIAWGAPSVIEDCTFLGNGAKIGGAIYSRDQGNILNCRFIANAAGEAGGAIYIEETEATVISCTFFGNTAPYAGACCADDQARLSIVNTILWNGGDEIGVSEDSLAQVMYSDVQGGWPGEGNIDVDPLFAAPGYWDLNGTSDDLNDDYWVEGDYHLKSQAGRWDPAIESWAIDGVTSPCIDAGDPYSPIGLEPFPNGGRVNMGAYGGTTEASKSYFGEPLCETIIAGDINGDCKVDFTDLAILIDHWHEDPIQQ